MWSSSESVRIKRRAFEIFDIGALVVLELPFAPFYAIIGTGSFPRSAPTAGAACALKGCRIFYKGTAINAQDLLAISNCRFLLFCENKNN